MPLFLAGSIYCWLCGIWLFVRRIMANNAAKKMYYIAKRLLN